MTIGGTPYIEPNSHQDYCSKKTLYTPETVSFIIITAVLTGGFFLPHASRGLLTPLTPFCYGRLSVYVLDSQFVMLGGRQTIFSTPYFQFEKRFDFLFVYVMNTWDYVLGLHAWHHGKRRKLSWKVMEKSWNFIIRFLCLSVLCKFAFALIIDMRKHTANKKNGWIFTPTVWGLNCLCVRYTTIVMRKYIFIFNRFKYLYRNATALIRFR